jgi:hypothetical protein
MRYTVKWHPSAEDELARLWLGAPDPGAVTKAADRIDRVLSSDPEAQGEEFYGDRLLIELPLGVVFTVRAADRLVQVLQVWHS